MSHTACFSTAYVDSHFVSHIETKLHIFPYMAASDSESSEGSGLAQPGAGSAHGLCDLCKVPVPTSSKSACTRFGFRNLHKACYNALQALARVAKGKGDPGMEKDVEDTLREGPERFRDMALALRTDRSRSR